MAADCSVAWMPPIVSARMWLPVHDKLIALFLFHDSAAAHVLFFPLCLSSFHVPDAAAAADRGVNTFSPEGRLFSECGSHRGPRIAVFAVRTRCADDAGAVPHAGGHDRRVNIFSPGSPPTSQPHRLFPSLQAIKIGTTAVGIARPRASSSPSRSACCRRCRSRRSVEKIYEIDLHIGCAMSGLSADARTLVDHARSESQYHRFTFNEPMPVESLTQAVCDLALSFGEGDEEVTMARPFGVALLVAGWDHKGPVLYHTDPSGTFTRFDAKAIGAGSEGAQTALQEQFHKNLTLLGGGDDGHHHSEAGHGGEARRHQRRGGERAHAAGAAEGLSDGGLPLRARGEGGTAVQELQQGGASRRRSRARRRRIRVVVSGASHVRSKGCEEQMCAAEWGGSSAIVPHAGRLLDLGTVVVSRAAYRMRCGCRRLLCVASNQPTHQPAMTGVAGSAAHKHTKTSIFDMGTQI